MQGRAVTAACDNERVGTRLVLRLAGERASLGQADAVDVARLILGANAVMNRTASIIAGRQPGLRGPLPKGIAEAVRLQLHGISEGSLVLEFELPDSLDETHALDLDDTPLGEATALTALAVLEGSETGYSDTAAAWNQLASELDIGGRNESLTFIMPSHARPHAVLDRDARTRLAGTARSRERSDAADERIGILYEADFEMNSARLRSADGASVVVRFDDDQAASVKDALRKKTRLQGHITYNERTSEVVAVDLIEILRADQLELSLSVGDFWDTKSVAELAEAQGVEPIYSVEVLRDDDITEEEAEAFIAELGL